MKQGKEMIESCKISRIEENLLRLRKVLNAVLSAHYSLSDRMDALNNIQGVVMNLVRDTNNVCRDINLNFLSKEENIRFLGLMSDVEFAIEAYEGALKETKVLIDLPYIGKKLPKTPGRPKASSNKHLKDFLKGCDSDKVIQAIKNDTNKKRAGYFGQMLIALWDLGYIHLSDIGKELYEAIKNDFEEAPSISSLRKICPQTKWKIEEYRDTNKSKIEELKRLF